MFRDLTVSQIIYSSQFREMNVDLGGWTTKLGLPNLQVLLDYPKMSYLRQAIILILNSFQMACLQILPSIYNNSIQLLCSTGE